MKKTIFIALVLLILSLSFFLINLKLLNSNTLIQANFYLNSKIKDTINAPNQDLDEIVNSINNSKKIKTSLDIENDIPLTIEFLHNNSKKETFIFYFKDSLLYFYFKDSLYKLNDDDSKLLLTKKLFYSIYPNNINPTFTLKSNNKEYFPLTIENTILFKLIDNTYSKITKHNDKVDYDISLKSPSTFKVNIYPKPDLLELYANDEKINIENYKFIPKEIFGNTKYTLIATWKKHNRDFYGTKKWTFNIDMNLPAKMEITPLEAYQGDYFIVKLKNIPDNSKVILKQNLIKNIKIWEPSKNERFAIIPLNYYVKSGNYKLEFYLESNQNKRKISEINLKVKNKNFDKQYLVIDEKVANTTKNEKAYTEYAKIFSPVREKSVNKKLWEGKFILPVEGRISTEFGMMRYVNGSLTSYRHSGIDLAVKEGTEIKATNTGKVVLSTELIMTGNTIVIDHGLGIFSVYFHLNSLYIKKDDFVKKGDIIGTVGTTGFSTGPHLHFTMSYYKTNLNPHTFIDFGIK